jgi:hypothetical protein
MCLTKRIQEIQAQKAVLDAKILQFEQLESKTQPVTEMLKKLIEDYREIAPEELPSLLTKISEMCFFDLSADKSAQKESEFKQSGFQSPLEYEMIDLVSENTAPQPEYEPEECQDTEEMGSNFTEDESEDEDSSDDPATQQAEHALFAEKFIQQFKTDQELVMVKPEAKLSIDPRIELFRGSLNLTSMDVTAKMMPSTSGKKLSGVSFCFSDLEGKKLFESTQTASEIRDQQPLFLALKLVSAWKSKQKALPVNHWKKPQDAFTELVKLSNAVGYIRRKDNGEILAGYAAFSNRTPEGNKTVTMAKSRLAKWAEWLSGTFQIKCDAPRVPKCMVSDNSKQPFAYEIKIKGLTMWQLEKLAEEDFSLLPGEMEEKLQNQELRRSELKTPATPEEATSTGAESTSDGLTDEQYFKAVDEELALDDDADSITPRPVVKFTGLALGTECGLNEDEIELVEMAVAAISACDSEMVRSVNSVFREVCEKNAANRVKVWNALTEDEQQTYKLLLQMEFAKAPDFSDQTPEYIVYSDGKMSANVWISLRTIDGKATRVWRYKGQVDDIRYTTKEAAAIAAIQQQAG